LVGGVKNPIKHMHPAMAEAPATEVTEAAFLYGAAAMALAAADEDEEEG
jgi:hypothetical protein